MIIDEAKTYEADGDKFNKRVQIAGTSSASGALPVTDVDPDYMHFEPDKLADVTNGDDGTYTYYVDMSAHYQFGLQAILDGGSGTVTVTIEATMQADGTAPASCAYDDVTNDVFGAASFTASFFKVDTNNILKNAKYVKVKVVAATTAANDADWTLYATRTL
jgi:hypothetical protein